MRIALRLYRKSIYERNLFNVFCLLFVFKSLTQKPSVLLFVLFDGSTALLLMPLLRIPLCRHLKSLFICLYSYLFTAFVQWNFYFSLSQSISLAHWLNSRWCAKHWLHTSSYVFTLIFFIPKWFKLLLVFVYVENTKCSIEVNEMCSHTLSLSTSIFVCRSRSIRCSAIRLFQLQPLVDCVISLSRSILQNTAKSNR